MCLAKAAKGAKVEKKHPPGSVVSLRHDEINYAREAPGPSLNVPHLYLSAFVSFAAFARQLFGLERRSPTVWLLQPARRAGDRRSKHTDLPAIHELLTFRAALCSQHLNKICN